MDTVRVVYSRSLTLGSALIRAGSWWGPWSHCGVVDQGFVIEALAIKGGVVATPFEQFEDRSTALEVVEFRVPDAKPAIDWAWTTVGSPYDWGGVLGIPFREREWDRPGRWYCSEHVEVFLRKAGLDRWRRGLHGISPCQSYFNKSSYA